METMKCRCYDGRMRVIGKKGNVTIWGCNNPSCHRYVPNDYHPSKPKYKAPHVDKNEIMEVFV